MNNLQITYFLDAVECKNFSAAAKKHRISQPAISRVISALEKELGAELFERKKNGVKLTVAGEIYYELFAEFRQRLFQAEQQVAEQKYAYYDPVRIGILSNFDMSEQLICIKRKIREKFADIRIQTVICTDFSDIFRRLEEGEIEGALTIDDRLRRKKSYDFVVLEKGKRILAFSKKHPLADRDNLTPWDFSEETFLVLDEEGVGARMARAYCKPYGFQPRMMPVSDIESLVMGIQNQEGVAIIDPWMRITSNTDFGYIELAESDELIFVWKKDVL